MRPLQSILPGVLIFGIMASLSGCSREIVINHYPAFYDPNIRTVAVVPFKNYSARKGIGRMAAGHLTAALIANQTYNVVGPVQLRLMLKKPNLPYPLPDDYKAAAEELNKIGNIQAFITGQVLGSSVLGKNGPELDRGSQTAYAAYPNDKTGIAGKIRSNSGIEISYAALYGDVSLPKIRRIDEERGEEEEEEGGFGDYDEDEDGFDDYYDYDTYPGWDYYYPGYYGWYYYDYLTYANITVNAWVISIPDGKVIGSAAVRASARTESYVPVPANFTIQKAMRKLTRKLVYNLAIVPVKIKINPSNDLKLADNAGTRWHYTDSFSKTGRRLFVIVCLPPAAARNHLEITITPRKKVAMAVIEQDIVWSGAEPCQSYEFSPEKIAAVNGTGDYTVNVYLNGQIIMSRNFKIR